MAKGVVQRLFSTPLLVERIEDAAFNQALETTILERRTSHPGIKRSNVGGWHSDLGIFDWGGEAARRLREETLALVSANTKYAAGLEHTGFHWRIDGWANVNERGSTNSRHVHGGAYWSAVYYVRIDKGTGGSLILHDTRMPTLAMHAPFLRFKDSGPERDARIIPKPGLLIAFPSWLPHEVEPWDGDGVRISIAMNIAAVAPGDALQTLKQGTPAATRAAASQSKKEQK